MASSKFVKDPGSFRDPEGYVFLHDKDVYRALKDSSHAKMVKLCESDFFKKHVQENTIIETKVVKNSFDKKIINSSFLLQHKKIERITYPYEWSFYMLKDAALLTLAILKDCLNNGFILKDGTAWNLTFYKGKMCFFDILSIDEYKEGQVWNGYGQFCREFLYPLLIKAHKDIDYNHFFKGSLKGIEPEIANAFFSVLDWRKPGIFKHVFLNAKLTHQTTIAKSKIQNNLQLPKASLLNIVNNLISTITGLNPKNYNSVWKNYTTDNTYAQQDVLDKQKFITSSLGKFKNANALIDLGCNTGDYSVLVAEKLDVISCDIDAACIDQVYLRGKSLSNNILPIVLDLMNPSSQCGWRLEERASIFSRIKADAFQALALIHHICIASNVPLDSFVEFLSKVAPQGIVEWVDKDDPMVQFLLRNREDVFVDYHWDSFESLLKKYFKIEKVTEINNGTRKLCLLLPLK